MKGWNIYAGVMLGFLAKVLYDLFHLLMVQYYPLPLPYVQTAVAGLAVVVVIGLPLGYRQAKVTNR